jgi:hypothetical protein
MKIIVSDTGPLLHLIESNLLWILNKAGRVHIPSIVLLELNELASVSLPEWIIVDALSAKEKQDSENLLLSGILDAGEAGAILLAKRVQADWFLTDDTEARIFAKSLGMEVHGSLGMLLWASAVGHLSYPEAEKALDVLSKTSLWISNDILTEARAALAKMQQQP